MGFACTTAFVMMGGCCMVINRFFVGDLSKRSQEQDDADEAARNAHTRQAKEAEDDD
jgi:hypothetical protein